MRNPAKADHLSRSKLINLGSSILRGQLGQERREMGFNDLIQERLFGAVAGIARRAIFPDTGVPASQ